MFENACAPDFKAYRQWFVESCFPGKVAASKKARLTKHSNNSPAVERILKFYQNALNAFQMLAQRG
jgi:hypothetical protein